MDIRAPSVDAAVHTRDKSLKFVDGVTGCIGDASLLGGRQRFVRDQRLDEHLMHLARVADNLPYVWTGETGRGEDARLCYCRFECGGDAVEFGGVHALILPHALMRVDHVGAGRTFKPHERTHDQLGVRPRASP